MPAQVETRNADKKHTRWHAMKRWLKQVDEGMNYDPQERANTMIRQLSRKIEQLGTRVNEVEETSVAR